MKFKSTMVISTVILALLFGALPAAHAQGTTYISNLEANSLSGISIASNAWVAQSFVTGANTRGYALDSVQLGMGPATGTPTGFSVSLFANNITRNEPSSLIEILTGSSNPVLAGIFNYTSTGQTMLPSTKYWIVTKAQSSQIGGAFNVSLASYFDYTSADNWWTDRFVQTSSGNSNWVFSQLGFDIHFAINATTVPEPSFLVLLGMGGSFLFTRLARKSRSKILRQP